MLVKHLRIGRDRQGRGIRKAAMVVTLGDPLTTTAAAPIAARATAAAIKPRASILQHRFNRLAVAIP